MLNGRKIWLLPPQWMALPSPAIDALPSRIAISEAPRAAGYRGSDFVLWHKAEVFGTAAILSAF